MRSYDHRKIEKKWQSAWKKKKLFRAADASKRKKYYCLIEFPYPSGDGLHVGHIRSNTAMDVIARKRRAEGFDVLYPIGWDAFGLPTENYAVKTGIHPKIVTKRNTDNFRRQLTALGFSFDWSREINTSDPNYYRWTQWIFLQFWKRGLAYKKKMAINWCPKDLIGLANEEVVDGCCERCGTPVVRREREQWMLAITKYADRLAADLDSVDYLERIKIQQRNWIGKSEGVNFKCKIKDLGITVEMYNSVPQTYRAETFTVIAPEHHLIPKLVKGTKYEKPVLDFVEKLQQRKTQKNFETEKELEGIFTGRYIENYAGTGRDLPIWIASYVVSDYGTGIVNASAHDERDFAFAKKHNIPLHEVVEPLLVKTTAEDGIRKGLPLVERDVVIPIVKHWSEDKYLCLRWKANSWKGFVGGGIERGENPITAGMREVTEETGYKNLTFEKKLGGIIHSQFYHTIRKENRFAHFVPLLYRLADGERSEIAKHEQALHDVYWLTPKEVSSFVNREDMRLIWERVQGIEKPIIKNGILLEPAEFKGREWSEVRPDIITYLVEKGYATRAVNYKLRDWIFSRQRYWGEPIPLIFCEKCGWVAVPEKDLPVKLPNIKDFKPRENGESPLAGASRWVNVKCPACKGPARRETDVMPNWAGSSWYYLAYLVKKAKSYNLKAKSPLRHWLPVDWYNGGMEHTTLHLLYSRFWHKFLFDLGLVPTSEPYAKRTSHGLILAEGGVKMSKSKGNVINPDELVARFGADSVRLYEMFMGPFDQAIAWNTDGIVGTRRFLEKVWRAAAKVSETHEAPKALQALLHQTIKKVSEDIEAMKFNTAVSQLMICANEFEKVPAVPRPSYEVFLKLLGPFAPHIAEELWRDLGHARSISLEPWPAFDAGELQAGNLSLVVQIDGKVRASFPAEPSLAEDEALRRALRVPEAAKWTAGREIRLAKYIPGRLVSIVTRPS